MCAFFFYGIANLYDPPPPPPSAWSRIKPWTNLAADMRANNLATSHTLLIQSPRSYQGHFFRGYILINLYRNSPRMFSLYFHFTVSTLAVIEIRTFSSGNVQSRGVARIRGWHACLAQGIVPIKKNWEGIQNRETE